MWRIQILNLAARWPRPYSGLTEQVPLRTGLAVVDQRSWVHVLSVKPRGCVWEIDVWVLPALLQRLKGWGSACQCSDHMPHTASNWSAWLSSQKKASSKDDAQESPQTAEDKQTMDMNYWNHVLWSDETKINVFGSDGVKRVWQQPGEVYKDKSVLSTVKHDGGSVMVWGCMSSACTGELQFIEGTMNANMYRDILKQSMISSFRRLGRRAVSQHDNNHCLAIEAECKGNGLIDLTPIEHLWGILKRSVEERKVSNIHPLRDVIIEEWKRTPVATCEALVNSMPKRVKAVLENYGGHTKYWQFGPNLDIFT